MAAYYWSLMYTEGVRLERPPARPVWAANSSAGGGEQVTRTQQRWKYRQGVAPKAKLTTLAAALGCERRRSLETL